MTNLINIEDAFLLTSYANIIRSLVYFIQQNTFFFLINCFFSVYFYKTKIFLKIFTENVSPDPLERPPYLISQVYLVQLCNKQLSSLSIHCILQNKYGKYMLLRRSFQQLNFRCFQMFQLSWKIAKLNYFVIVRVIVEFSNSNFLLLFILYFQKINYSWKDYEKK